MVLNLYPYNYYVLYAAIAALMVVIVMIGTKALKALDGLKVLMPLLQDSEKNKTQLEEKTKVVKKMSDDAADVTHKVIVAAPLIYAVYQAIKNNRAEEERKPTRVVIEKVLREKAETKVLRENIGRIFE